jgi:hypothetical protein
MILTRCPPWLGRARILPTVAQMSLQLVHRAMQRRISSGISARQPSAHVVHVCAHSKHASIHLASISPSIERLFGDAPIISVTLPIRMPSQSGNLLAWVP